MQTIQSKATIITRTLLTAWPDPTQCLAETEYYPAFDVYQAVEGALLLDEDDVEAAAEAAMDVLWAGGIR